MRLLQNKQQFFITLPKQIIEAKEWKKGDKIKVKLDKHGDIILKKVDKKISKVIEKQPEEVPKSSQIESCANF